ncbi:MAG TPA: NADH-quinone oxidoreductase subunit NuoB [Acidimicrobiales bacterium]|nr:NADH-quinone oxidoreductase subunit NuoB [Acidimicrobiales bacterium]
MSTFRHRKGSIFRSLFSRARTELAPTMPDVVRGTRLRGSLQLRHVDVGSCNGCEVEIASAFAPTYDAARFGARLVASPRHADGVLVTGVVTRNMAGALVRTLDALPRPAVVVACGDCAVNGGIFRDAYGVAGTLDSFVDVDVRIPGCPPHPEAITQALRSLTGR